LFGPGRFNYDYRKASGRKKLKFFSGKFALVADKPLLWESPEGGGKTTALCAKGSFGTCPRESFFREILKQLEFLIYYRTLCQRVLWDLSKGKFFQGNFKTIGVFNLLPHSVPKGPLGLVQGKVFSGKF
jgi:hypothetical protein